MPQSSALLTDETARLSADYDNELPVKKNLMKLNKQTYLSHVSSDCTVLGKLLFKSNFKSNLSMSTITWLEK